MPVAAEASGVIRSVAAGVDDGAEGAAPPGGLVIGFQAPMFGSASVAGSRSM